MSSLPTKPRYASLGLVSEGTVKPEDLIPRFAGVLRELNGNKKLLSQCDNIDWSDDSDEAADSRSYLVGQLLGSLDEYAPPLCNFGTRRDDGAVTSGDGAGDGASYGFWLAVNLHAHAELAEQGVHVCNRLPPDLAHASDAKFWKDSIKIEYFLVVTDDGNATLYDTQGVEIWSIV